MEQEAEILFLNNRMRQALRSLRPVLRSPLFLPVQRCQEFRKPVVATSSSGRDFRRAAETFGSLPRHNPRGETGRGGQETAPSTTTRYDSI